MKTTLNFRHPFKNLAQQQKSDPAAKFNPGPLSISWLSQNITRTREVSVAADPGSDCTVVVVVVAFSYK